MGEVSRLFPLKLLWEGAVDTMKPKSEYLPGCMSPWSMALAGENITLLP